MNPNYAPRTPEARLDRLSEEVGEVIIEAGRLLQVIGKYRRFGPCSKHPDGGPTNIELMLKVMGDLRNELSDLSDATLSVEADILDHLPCIAVPA